MAPNLFPMVTYLSTLFSLAFCFDRIAFKVIDDSIADAEQVNMFKFVADMVIHLDRSRELGIICLFRSAWFTPAVRLPFPAAPMTLNGGI